MSCIYVYIAFVHVCVCMCGCVGVDVEVFVSGLLRVLSSILHYFLHNSAGFVWVTEKSFIQRQYKSARVRGISNKLSKKQMTFIFVMRSNCIK